MDSITAKEEQRAKWRAYAKAYYERHKEEKRRRTLQAYYRKTGHQPKAFAKLVIGGG